MINGNTFDIIKTIEDQSVNMILTDPPYGMDYQSNRRTKSDKFSKISNDNALDWLDGFVNESYRVLKDDSAMYVFCSWHNVDVFKASFERKFKLKNILVWVKNNHGSGDLKGSYAPKHEFILFMNKGRSIFRNGRKPDVFECDKVSGSKMVHPTEKPIELLKTFILDSSDENDLIFDPFMGSGTTGIAAKETNRNFFGIELDETYYNIAKNRIDGINNIDSFFADRG